MTTRVFIADDHPIVRVGLREILSESSDIEVIGECSSGTELADLVPTLHADVLLLDISMPGPGFLELLRLTSARPPLRILVLSVYPEDQYAISALRAGAHGYLTKDRSPDQLIGAIRQVRAGRRFISPELADLLAARIGGGQAVNPHERLSTRETEVMLLLARGLPTKQVAARLAVSVKTVSTYRHRLLEKLGVQSDADIVRYVISHGLDN